MVKPEPKKRKLKFNDCDTVLSDARSLMEHGYISNGNWTLGQTCCHLAEWMRYPLDGFPQPPIFMRPIFWIMKHTVAPGMKRRIMAEGFKGGMPTAPESVPKPAETSDEQGLVKLQKTINRVQAYDGELVPSPLFGPMDKQMLLKVSLLHAEHHLGYLEPHRSSTERDR